MYNVHVYVHVYVQCTCTCICTMYNVHVYMYMYMYMYMYNVHVHVCVIHHWEMWFFDFFMYTCTCTCTSIPRYFGGCSEIEYLVVGLVLPHCIYTIQLYIFGRINSGGRETNWEREHPSAPTPPPVLRTQEYKL